MIHTEYALARITEYRRSGISPYVMEVYVPPSADYIGSFIFTIQLFYIIYNLLLICFAVFST